MAKNKTINNTQINNSLMSNMVKETRAMKEAVDNLTVSLDILLNKTKEYNNNKEKLLEIEKNIKKELEDQSKIKKKDLSDLKTQIENYKTLNKLVKDKSALESKIKKATTPEEKEVLTKMLNEVTGSIDSLKAAGYTKGANNETTQEELETMNAEKLNDVLSEVFGDTFDPNGEISKMAAGLMSDSRALEKIGTTITNLSPTAVKLLTTLVKTIESLSNKLEKSVETAMDNISENLSIYNTRLEGLYSDQGADYGLLASTVANAFSANPFLNIQTYLKNITNLTDKGIAYNVEQRALLETLSDSISTTFDVTSEALTRLVRLQSSDTTMAYMGTEVKLNEFLNNIFKDTSYLGTSSGSGVYDSVYNAITDSMSLLSAEEAVGYNYNVQKWLGSLYSVGLSSDAVTKIAQGINALGTGNVTELQNSSLGTVFALASENAGLSYADLLTKGLNSSNVNTLLGSVVSSLQQIVTNTSDQVTRNAWAEITGMSVADLRSLTNISSEYMNNISSSNMTYSSAISRVNESINSLNSKYTIETMLSNYLDNTIAGYGYEMAGDEERYLHYRLGKIATELGVEGAVSGLATGNWVGAAISGTGALLGSLSTAWSVAKPLYNTISSFLSGGIGLLTGSYGEKNNIKALLSTGYGIDTAELYKYGGTVLTSDGLLVANSQTFSSTGSRYGSTSSSDVTGAEETITQESYLNQLLKEVKDFKTLSAEKYTDLIIEVKDNTYTVGGKIDNLHDTGAGGPTFA